MEGCFLPQHHSFLHRNFTPKIKGGMEIDPNVKSTTVLVTLLSPATIDSIPYINLFLLQILFHYIQAQANVDILPTPEASHTNDFNWYNDSGATHHVTNSIGNLSIHSGYDGPNQELDMGNILLKGFLRDGIYCLSSDPPPQ
ncbi:hypothetical protein CFOL_v3_35191 [Cephalotus follicularis]|uniref:Uncharacterized protein n=1 Tax=Cephalotus follicularis TaxID=3775 RepID=A0A1Q3DHC0_CEPFO|nr:hypothetical protein CFOL_v3_35191 [Cephalotus follicularis]